MGALVPVILALVGLGVGVGVGYVTRPDPPPPEEPLAEEQAPEPATPGSKPQDEEAYDYARLNNQFVIPVVRGDAVEALVVMSLTLEVSLGETETVFAREPRLRDGFLRDLFDHANIGGFDIGFTQSGNLAILRAALLETARESLGDVVHDILITDILRQEV
ncbi:MAG: flagellar basal body-associated FliL family protein [Pseudomonadota bacterium]